VHAYDLDVSDRLRVAETAKKVCLFAFNNAKSTTIFLFKYLCHGGDLT